jgi:hypothetical protein
VSCFNFERVKALVFKLFGECFKPTVWDGDMYINSSGLSKIYSSEPTVWDGDGMNSRNTQLKLDCSKPTVWDGDGSIHALITLNSSSCSEPTAWDGYTQEMYRGFEISLRWVPSPLCGITAPIPRYLVMR